MEFTQDTELAQFFSESAALEAAAMAACPIRHEGLRDAMERVAAYGRGSRHYPDRVLTTDGFIALQGRELGYRVYRRAGFPSDAPALLYAHGGGWVVGSIHTHDALCAEMALRTGCVVVSLQYRRAPENPFPAAHEDMWAAWQWLYSHANLLGVDPCRIALGGDSAGGHLALGCAIRRVLDGGSMPVADRLLLWYPNTERMARTESRALFDKGFGLTGEAMEYFWRCYEAGNAYDAEHPILYPGHMRQLPILPPAVIVTAEFDLLRDEAENYAHRLQAAGSRVTLLRAQGLPHSFARLLEESRSAGAWVRRGCQAFVDLHP